jgi:ABC-2 type transport system ATP-binding protein
MTNNLAIHTCGLTKQFDRHLAVHDVDLEIGRGEVYGLIGPNGAGKTTCIRMLALVEEPTQGEIYINNEPVLRGKRNMALKRWIGYLPDDFPVYEDLTVWDYLDYFARLYHLQEPRRSQRIRAVLELTGLTNKRYSSTAILSRGMKQRLSLARTIIHEPIVLLLDEPVSGLDPIARLEFREIIKTLQEAGMTIVISSHILSDLADFCTAIGVMELGYLVENAPLQELYRRFSRQRLLLSTLGSLDALLTELRHYPGVQSWEVLSNQQVCLEFSGTTEESAQLLRSLVQTGIPLTEFHRLQEDLESIFLKLGHQQAS